MSKSFVESVALSSTKGNTGKLLTRVGSNRKDHRRWVFTKFGRVSDLKLFFNSIKNLMKSEKLGEIRRKVRFWCLQYEITPKTGKLHLQGYLEFLDPITYSAIGKNIRDCTGHWEKAIGTKDQNIAYCTKIESRAPGTQPTIWPTEDLDEYKDGIEAEAKDLVLQCLTTSRSDSSETSSSAAIGTGNPPPPPASGGSPTYKKWKERRTKRLTEDSGQWNWMKRKNDGSFERWREFLVEEYGEDVVSKYC